MAGAGGTGQQQPDQLESIREALVKHIASKLGGEEPQPPQYQPQPLTPFQGYAQARNPQMAGQLEQAYQAPAQAQFQQQQAAFEQAMLGRQQALQIGAGMIKQKNDALDYQRALETERHNRAMESKPESMAFLSTPQGYFPVGRKTGEVGSALQSPSGSTLYPPPPAGVVSDISAQTATLSGIDSLRDAYREIRQKVAGQSTAGQVVRGTLGETRLGGALAPDYAKYTAQRRASLNAYIKSVTGAQFSVAELQRYEGQYPEPWDPEDVADVKLEALRQRATTDMQAKLRTFPGASGSAPVAETDEQRKQRLRLKYGIR